MRKGELIFNYALLFGPIALGLGMVWTMGLVTLMPKVTLWGMMALFLFGFVLFAKAKISVIKEGQLFSFGPSKMSKQNRITYFVGYGGMFLGLLLLIGFAFVER